MAGLSAVLYHYPCPDGVFAALAAHLYHKQTNQRVQFIPNTVYSPRSVEEVAALAPTVVYLLDFVGPPGFALDLAHRVNRVVVLDHHKTAEESLLGSSSAPPPPNMEVVIDKGRSGATIAWDFFSGRLQEGGEGEGEGEAGVNGAAVAESRTLVPLEDTPRVHRLFKYIEDADLWQWALPGSKAFSSGFKDRGLDFDASSNDALFDELLSLDPEALIKAGEATLAEKQRLIDAALEGSFRVELGGGRFGTCLAVSADGISHLRSDLGNQLAEKSLAMGLRPIGVVAYLEEGMSDKTLIKVSLRSKGEEDTTPVSETYGGGGHRNASSFLMPREAFESWKR